MLARCVQLNRTESGTIGRRALTKVERSGGLRGPLLMLAAALALLWAAPAQGQIIGRVIDAETRGPVANAGVALLDSAGTARAQVVTDENGRFVMAPASGPGQYDVQVIALGYVGAPSDPVDYTGESVFLEIALSPAPIEMEGIEVRVEALDPALEAQGFYQRERTTGGLFVDPEDLENRVLVRASEALRRLPGVNVRGGEPTFTRVGGGLGGGCGQPPDVWVDGVPVRRGGGTPGVPQRFDDLLPAPQNIAAVEAYPGGASVPAQFGGVSGGCGVIVVWTKRGRVRR